MSAKRVLVVDDERCITDTLVVILRKAGYEVTGCYNAESALRECEAFKPELVITDVSMPGMNGVDLAVELKQKYPACKILLISGHASTVNLLEKAKIQGYGFDLLTKPVHPSDLLSRLAA